LECKEKGIRGEKMMYTDEVKQGLVNYMSNLRDGRDRLKKRSKDAERALLGYGVERKTDERGEEKERVMKKIARVYGDLVEEVREVRRDVERLRRR